MGCVSSKNLAKFEAATGIDVDGDGKAGGKKTDRSAKKYLAGVTGGAGADGGNPNQVGDRELDDGANIPLSTCDGNKKSLFIGINYFGSSAELGGCITDVVNIKEFVSRRFGFQTDDAHMRTFTDDDKANMPTKANILAGMAWLVEGAQSGDSLFLHYSGHGGSVKDVSPDKDEVDGKDECLYPCDHETAGTIVDDDLHKLLVAGLPQGVRLTAIMDCCHSGSVFDLPYSYGVDAGGVVAEKDNRKIMMQAAMAAGLAFKKGDTKMALAEAKKAAFAFMASRKGKSDDANQAPAGGDGTGGLTESQIEIRTAVADVIQFSGCMDSQTSADASIGNERCGAMSWAFKGVCQESGAEKLSYTTLLTRVREKLHGKYSQVPQLSTGHRMDMSAEFKM